MCLAVPGQVISMQHGEAITQMHGTQIRVSTVLVPGVIVGDWVLVHAGFAIQKLDETQVRQSFAILEDVRAANQLADEAAESATSAGGVP